MASPPQRLRVLRLYRFVTSSWFLLKELVVTIADQMEAKGRHFLKEAINWSPNRKAFHDAVEMLRDSFEANRHLSTHQQIEQAIARGERLLQENRHPQPYIGALSRYRFCSWATI